MSAQAEEPAPTEHVPLPPPSPGVPPRAGTERRRVSPTAIIVIVSTVSAIFIALGFFALFRESPNSAPQVAAPQSTNTTVANVDAISVTLAGITSETLVLEGEVVVVKAIVSIGVADVVLFVDGVIVATGTTSGQLRWTATAGAHEIWARAEVDGVIAISDKTTVVVDSEPDDTAVAPSETVLATDPTTPPPPVRPATLYAGLAVVREQPSLDAPEVTRLRDQSGVALSVIGDNHNGWYEIGAPVTGWIFGAFILPPDTGFAVAETTNATPARLVNATGGDLGVSNASGDKVLVTGDSGSLWRVILADGSVAFVDKSAVRIVS